MHVNDAYMCNKRHQFFQRLINSLGIYRTIFLIFLLGSESWFLLSLLRNVIVSGVVLLDASLFLNYLLQSVGFGIFLVPVIFAEGRFFKRRSSQQLKKDDKTNDELESNHL